MKKEAVELRWIEMPNASPRPMIVATDDQWIRMLKGLPEMDRLHAYYHAHRRQMSLLVPVLRQEDV